MENDNIKVILERYNNGRATKADIVAIEQLIELGTIDLEELLDLKQMDNELHRIGSPEPSFQLDDRFYAFLAKEKKKQQAFTFMEWFAFSWPAPKMAFGVLTFLLGLALGYFLLPKNESEKTELTALNEEVTSLKEMMMLALLEKESATDRLKAVSLTHEFDDASEAVTRALLKTLNKDSNVNVRLAALDALRPYIENDTVRAELIKSIGKQDSPLVQIALAELMAAVQEKSSVKEFEKLLKNEKTPEEIKKRIREKIEVII